MEDIEYFHTYVVNTKHRWIGKSILDVMSTEFLLRPREFYEAAIKVGTITVNEKIVNPEYLIKNQDVIRHTTHIHEPNPPKINIIYKCEDYLVVNKPYGIPCHPTGQYYEYTVTRALFKDKNVGCVNRLDLPVSGVLIISLENSDVVHSKLMDAQKIYIAKVEGTFPDYIEVEEKIETLNGRVHIISDKGKYSKTIFTKVSSNELFSIVKCQPITGRTHQIRIHLKHVGFPIINDIIYGNYSLPPILLKEDGKCNAKHQPNMKIEQFKFIVANCPGRCNRTFQMSEQFLCLHAWKYIFDDKTFEAELPEWAKL